MTHKDYVWALKKAAVETGKSALISRLTLKLPFLFNPFLSPITTYVLGKIVEILIDETEFSIFFFYTDMRVNREGKEFSEAAMKNYEAQKSGDKRAIAKAEKELMEKFKTFAVIGTHNSDKEV